MTVGARIDKAIAALQPDEHGEFDRAAANVGLRSLFDRAVIDWPAGTVKLAWKQGGVCAVPYAFALSATGATGSSEVQEL